VSEREQIRAALISLVGERGFGDLTVEALLERAGASRAAFDRDFADLEDCYHRVFAEVGREFMAQMAAVFGAEATWHEQLSAVAYAMLDWLREDPDRARFTFVESLNAGEATQGTRDEYFSWLFALIDQGRREMPDPDSLTPATAAAIGGTIFNQIRAEIEAGRVARLDLLAPKLIYSALLPYLGAEAAREIAYGDA
jgi:AcrR family transcriptional regulator